MSSFVGFLLIASAAGLSCRPTSAWQPYEHLKMPLASPLAGIDRPTHRLRRAPSFVPPTIAEPAASTLAGGRRAAPGWLSLNEGGSMDWWVSGPMVEDMVASYTRGLDDVPLPLQASIFRMIPAHPYETPTGLHGDPASHVLASTFLLDAPHEPLFVTRSDKVIDADYVILQSTFTNSTLLGRVVMKCPKWDVAFIKLQEPYSLDAYKQYVSEKLGGVVPEPFVAEDASHEAIEGAPVMVMGYMANQGSMLPADVEVGEGEGKLSYSPYTGPATLHGTLKDTLCSIENGVMLPHNVYVPFGTSGGPTVERNTGRVLGMSAVAYLEDEDDEMAPSEMPTFLSVFVWKLLMLARVYADNQKEEFTTIVGIPRLEKDWSKNETEMCFSEGLMKAGLASASYEEMAPLDVEIQQLREAFTDAVLRKHWDVLSVAFGMENIKKEDIDEMPAPIFFQVLHDLMYLWVNPHIHQVPARRDWVDRHRYLFPTVSELLGRNATALGMMGIDYFLASVQAYNANALNEMGQMVTQSMHASVLAQKDTDESIGAQPEG